MVKKAKLDILEIDIGHTDPGACRDEDAEKGIAAADGPADQDLERPADNRWRKLKFWILAGILLLILLLAGLALWYGKGKEEKNAIVPSELPEAV
ncbi:MAG: hypothetical protein FWE89_02660, partial [Syntrophaceae bacterium]|nr:hypothetical protein [Syntrophaceae bacterium]